MLEKERQWERGERQTKTAKCSVKFDLPSYRCETNRRCSSCVAQWGFGQGQAGSLQCCEYHPDKISPFAVLPICLPPPLSRLFSHRFGGKHPSISKWCQRSAHSHVIGTQGVPLASTYRLSAALIPSTSQHRPHGFFLPPVFLCLPWICFTIDVSRQKGFCWVKCVYNEKKWNVQ